MYMHVPTNSTEKLELASGCCKCGQSFFDSTAHWRVETWNPMRNFIYNARQGYLIIIRNWYSWHTYHLSSHYFDNKKWITFYGEKFNIDIKAQISSTSIRLGGGWWRKIWGESVTAKGTGGSEILSTSASILPSYRLAVHCNSKTNTCAAITRP